MGVAILRYAFSPEFLFDLGFYMAEKFKIGKSKGNGLAFQSFIMHN